MLILNMNGIFEMLIRKYLLQENMLMNVFLVVGI